MVPLKKINLIVRKADLKKAININYLSGAANRIRTCDPVITNDVHPSRPLPDKPKIFLCPHKLTFDYNDISRHHVTLRVH